MKLRTALAALLIVCLLSSCASAPEQMQVSVLCVSRQPLGDGTELMQPETRMIASASGTQLFRSLIAELSRTPAQSQLAPAIPDGVTLTDLTEEDGIVRCVFSESLASLSPAALTQLLCAVSGTLSELSGVSGVIICAGDTPMHEGILTGEAFVTQRDSLHIESYDLTLYYPNAAGTALESAVCTVRLPVNANQAEAVLQTLLSGPVTDEGYVIRFIPEGTRLYGASTEGGICTVNLSEEFLSSNIAAEDGTSLTVYAVVNSLAALPGVSGVQFLIEGEAVESYLHPHFNAVISPRTPGSMLEH